MRTQNQLVFRKLEPTLLVLLLFIYFFLNHLLVHFTYKFNSNVLRVLDLKTALKRRISILPDLVSYHCNRYGHHWITHRWGLVHDNIMTDNILKHSCNYTNLVFIGEVTKNTLSCFKKHVSNVCVLFLNVTYGRLRALTHQTDGRPSVNVGLSVRICHCGFCSVPYC